LHPDRSVPARGRLPASARSHALVAGAADDAAAGGVVGAAGAVVGCDVGTLKLDSDTAGASVGGG
jgi:hypothetical protein